MGQKRLLAMLFRFVPFALSFGTHASAHHSVSCAGHSLGLRWTHVLGEDAARREAQRWLTTWLESGGIIHGGRAH